MGVKLAREKRVVLERCTQEICTVIGSLNVSLGHLRSHAASVGFLKVCGRSADMLVSLYIDFRREAGNDHASREKSECRLCSSIKWIEEVTGKVT